MDLCLSKRALAFLFTTTLLITVGPTATALAQAESGEAPSAEAPEDPQLADYQGRLLSVAIDAVNGFPRHVQHDKNRSRAQEEIVHACLELGQPERALEYTELITNWRRGVGRAACAEYLAREGQAERARGLLELARADLEKAVADNEQGWRCETIQALIGSSYLLLDDPESAVAYIRGVSPAQYDPVAITSAWRIGAEDFEAVLGDQERLVDAEDFAVSRASLRLIVEFYRRFYDDAQRRELCEEKARATMERGSLPLMIRIEAFSLMIEAALEHEDQKNALRLVDDVQRLMESSPWTPQDQVALQGRLAAYRYRAGDEARARREADSALAFFKESRDQIYDLWRAEALTPIAEAWVDMGDRAKALDVYRRAIEEGALNPNSRPRAEDLAETLCSMAKKQVEPDEALWERILEIEAGLGDPW